MSKFKLPKPQEEVKVYIFLLMMTVLDAMDYDISKLPVWLPEGLELEEIGSIFAGIIVSN